MKLEGKYRYLAKNTFLFGVSSFGSKFLNFFLLPLYTAVLDTESYGISYLITTLSGISVFIFTICIASAVLRYSMDKAYNTEDVFLYGIEVVSIGGICMGAAVLLACSVNIFHWPSYCYFFLFLCFICNATNEIMSNYFRARDKVALVAVCGIVQTFVTIVINLLLLLRFHMGLRGYLLAMNSGLIVSILLYAVNLPYNALHPVRAFHQKELHQVMRRYSFPLIFNGIAWWMNASLDKFFLLYMIGASANGLYAAATKISGIISMIFNVFLSAWNLSAIREYDPEDKDGFFSKMYSYCLAFLSVVCSSLTLGNILISGFLFSKDFFEAWQYSSVMLFAALCTGMGGFAGNVFSAVKDSYSIMISTLIAAGINILANAILIPYCGILGATIATALSFYIVWMIRNFRVRRYIKYRINRKRDFVSMILLVMQIVFEHQKSHLYFAQSCILGCIVWLYRKEWIAIINKLKVR